MEFTASSNMEPGGRHTRIAFFLLTKKVKKINYFHVINVTVCDIVC